MQNFSHSEQCTEGVYLCIQYLGMVLLRTCPVLSVVCEDVASYVEVVYFDAFI
jgi:hypothetical protein